MSFYSLIYQKHPQFFQKHSHKQTSIGLIAIVPFNQQLPPGWRRLTLQQGTMIKNQLKSLLSTWSIVAFQTGKLDGSGYGNNISQSFGSQCGQGFILYPYGGISSDPSHYNNQYSCNSAYNNQAVNANCSAKSQNYINSIQLEEYQKVNTPIGLVVKVPIQLQIPHGFRALSLGQGVQIKQHLNQILGQWSIVAFQNGKIDGNGYGNNISQSFGSQCGEKFITSVSPGFILN